MHFNYMGEYLIKQTLKRLKCMYILIRRSHYVNKIVDVLAQFTRNLVKLKLRDSQRQRGTRILKI